MRTNAATVVSGIAFRTPDVAIHANFGASLAGRFRHKLLRKTVRRALLVADDGVEFFHECRGYVDIRSFELPAKKSTLNSYQNRPGHELVRHP
jgi:hypothetical protein